MIYNDKKDIRRAIKAAAALQGITLSDAARALNITPQELNDRFNRKQVSFDNMRDICRAIGCEIDFYIIPQENIKD
jgi:DNA-binding Xre family transcriptional regulator